MKKNIKCNPDVVNPSFGATLDCHTKTYSNWSIAEEISRLARIEGIKDIEPEYEIYKDGCVSSDMKLCLSF